MQRKDTSMKYFIDPVCWLKVSPDTKAFQAMHLMRTYYFCSENCRNAFLDDPEKYLDLKSLPWKGWGKHYFARFMNANASIKG